MLGIHNYNSKVTDDEYYWEKILNIIEPVIIGYYLLESIIKIIALGLY